MSDFLKKYREKKIISNAWIIFTSLVLALWINFFLVDSTNFWQSLKADVLSSTTKEDLSNIYLIKNWNKIYLRNSKKMDNIDKLTINLSYNPENVEIKNISSNIDWINILNLWNEPWINTLIITLSWSKNISSWVNILNIEINKKIEKTENLNIWWAYFIDTNGTNYDLTTSGISF